MVALHARGRYVRSCSVLTVRVILWRASVVKRAINPGRKEESVRRTENGEKNPEKIGGKTEGETERDGVSEKVLNRPIT